MKILNFGSLNIDKVYQVDHFIRPGETLGSEDYAEHVGGKGLNQSVALKKAGAEVYHAGAVGKDGKMLTDYLESVGVGTELISVTDVATGHAIIQVDRSGQNCILLFGGANKAIGTEQCDRVLDRFSRGDILLLQNEISNIDYIMNRAAERKMRIAFNPSPLDAGIPSLPLEKVEWLLVNETEGNGLTDETEPEKIINKLLSQYTDMKVVLTLGAEGVMYADRSGTVFCPAFKTQAVDTTAAGDTFTGYFLKSVADGLDIETALKRSSKASSITISRAGAAETIPFATEVEI